MKGGVDAFTVNEQVLASQPVRRRSPVRPRASLLTSARFKYVLPRAAERLGSAR